MLRLGWLGVTAPGAGARLLTTSVPGLEEVARFRVPIYIPVSVSSPPTMQCTNNKQYMYSQSGSQDLFAVTHLHKLHFIGIFLSVNVCYK